MRYVLSYIAIIYILGHIVNKGADSIPENYSNEIFTEVLMESGRIRGCGCAVRRAKTGLNVVREVQTSHAELRSAQTRVKAMQEAVVQSHEILKNEQTKYEVGRTMINFVMEAEAGVLNSQSLLSRAQRSEAIAQLALELSIAAETRCFVPFNCP
jgi:hypothetical protein